MVGGEVAVGIGWAGASYGLAAGNKRSRSKAATSAPAHGQERGRRKTVRRAERESLPATCGRRWRRRLGSARASFPSRHKRRSQASSSWAISESSSQTRLCWCPPGLGNGLSQTAFSSARRTFPAGFFRLLLVNPG